MLVIGSAQAVNILISIVRMKVLAVLLGPSGVGLLSIYNSLLEMVKQTAGLGMGSSGVREIASSRGDEATLSQVRQRSLCSASDTRDIGDDRRLAPARAHRDLAFW